MNKTKKITEGAMFLAIFGAMVMLDRLTGFWFSELVLLVPPIVIIMYGSKHGFKYALFLSAGLIILAFLLGNFYYYYLMNIPVGIITGIVYTYMISRNCNKGMLLFGAMLTYTIGEVIITYILYPLFGFPVSEMIDTFTSTFTSIAGVNEAFATFEKATNTSIMSFAIAMYFTSTIIVGVLEGILIHMLAVFILKRFKIKDLGKTALWDIKPNKVLCYICGLSMFSIFYLPNATNDMTRYIILTVITFSGFILLFYGYIFLVLYYAIIFKRRFPFFFILLILFVPVLLIALICIGFLYGAGPLRDYLERQLALLQ